MDSPIAALAFASAAIALLGGFMGGVAWLLG